MATLQAGSLYAAVAGGYVTLSPQFAAAILTCASGTFKWAGYTIVTPGGCVPCPPRASSRHQVAVPCPAGSDFDCCYACASGYLLWPSCVPACDITHAYLEGGARGCKACPAGQIQNRSTATTCVFCADLPEYGPNFYATSYGCARCSSLSYATPRPYATGCTPCASGEYVPSGTAACTRCPAGSVLKTTATW